MLKKVLPILCVTATAILIGCGGAGNSNTGTNTNTTTNTNRASSNTSAPANTASANTGTTSSSGEKIGVAECDDFLAKYDACVTGKVPAAARAQFESTMKQWREAWRKQAENPQTKAALAGVCKTSMESARTSMKSFGCAF